MKLQTSPAVILLPSRVEESFLKALQPSSAEDHSLSIRPMNEFSFDKAKQKILKLAEVLPYAGRLSLETPDYILDGDGGSLVRMGGVIEWNKKISVWILQEVELIIDWLCWSFNYVFEQTRTIESRRGLNE